MSHYVTHNRKRYEVVVGASGLPVRVRVDTIAGRWQTIWTRFHTGKSPHVKAIIKLALS